MKKTITIYELLELITNHSRIMAEKINQLIKNQKKIINQLKKD